MQFAKWGNIQPGIPRQRLNYCRTCTIIYTWNCSERRGTSTSLDLLSFSGCKRFRSSADVSTGWSLWLSNLSNSQLFVFVGLWSGWSPWLTNWRARLPARLPFRRKLTPPTRRLRSTWRTMSCWKRSGEVTTVGFRIQNHNEKLHLKHDVTECVLETDGGKGG